MWWLRKAADEKDVELKAVDQQLGDKLTELRSCQQQRTAEFLALWIVENVKWRWTFCQCQQHSLITEHDSVVKIASHYLFRYCLDTVIFLATRLSEFVVTVFSVSCITDCWSRLKMYYNAKYCIKWVLENTAKSPWKTLNFFLTNLWDPEYTIKQAWRLKNVFCLNVIKTCSFITFQFTDITVHKFNWATSAFALITGSIARSANLPVFSLLRGRFWGFLPRRGDTLHRWGWNLAWRRGPKVPSSMPNFTPIGATTRV